MRPAVMARGAALVVALGLLGSLAVTPALAASIVVNSLADTVADDGACTLREAISAANTDTASGASAGECAAGSGADTITFEVAGTITLASGELVIASDLTISGAGAITVSGAPANRVFLITGGTVTLSGLTITGGATGSNGGGILNNIGATLTVTNSTISGNTASFGGGIWNGGTVTVTNSTISGNTAAVGGGGIFNNVGTVTVTNSTISGNTAGFDGGGIFNDVGTVTVTNSTISGNTAAVGGGGISAAGTETLVNAIVAGNTAPVGPDIDFSAETITTSVIGVPGGMTLADILVPAGLADNGGPTQTIALALVAGNPAIDTATGAVCAAAPVSGLDQRGLPRPAACDIGAYEAQPPTIAAHADVTVPATSPDGAVVTYSPPAASDEQGGVATVACLPASGSTFPVGSTTVTCIASDAVGHTASGSFQVIVGAFVPAPTASPTASPTATPAASPTASPTATPAASPTASPTASPAALPDTATANGTHGPLVVLFSLGLLGLLAVTALGHPAVARRPRR